MLENPVWIAILVLLIIITLIVCVKAGAASSKRYRANEEIMKKLKEENILRNEFAVLTNSLIESSDSQRLFKGVAINLQKKISDADDMTAEFEKLSKEEKEIYALSFVVEDGGEKLSEFFKANGQPLTGEALDVFKKIFNGKATEIFESEYNAYDPENEASSFIQSEIDKEDEEFAGLVTAEDICINAGKMIKDNAESFVK